MDKEIIKGNKLIAEFVQLDACTDPDHKDDRCYVVPYARGYHKVKDLQYHSSWDWLMPVVEKIIALGWQFQLNSYGVSNDAQFINSNGHIRNVAWSTPLLATYNVVVDFLKWYNQTTNTNK